MKERQLQTVMRTVMRNAQSTKWVRAGLVALVALGSLAGCGSDANPGNGTGGTGGLPATEPLLPWAVGNSWTYRVTEAGMVSEKVTTVVEQAKVGGVGTFADTTAYLVVTRKGTDQMDKTESYQAPDATNPDRILRYRELSYGAMTGALQLEEYWQPPRMHIDGSLVTGNDVTWIDAYTEFKLPVGQQASPGVVTHDQWIVLSADEAVDVPKGHYPHSVHLQKTGGSTKEYWYVRGVGKVRETGGQTEELTDVTLKTSINALK
jgi:hypothetical protein